MFMFSYVIHIAGHTVELFSEPMVPPAGSAQQPLGMERGRDIRGIKREGPTGHGTMAFLWARVILGINSPLVVERMSSTALLSVAVEQLIQAFVGLMVLD